MSPSPDLEDFPPKRPSSTRRLIKVAKALVVLAVIGPAILVTALWVEHTRPATLPTPTGPFAVGRFTDAWIDDPGTRRELVVWIWYPAAAVQSGAVTDDYLPDPWRTAIERERGPLISTFLTRDLSRVHAHSIRNSAVSPEQRSYPVVIMRAGASLEVTNYSTLAEDLASHGYVVVGFDAPYRTGVVVFPDGRVMKRTPQNNPEFCLGRQDQDRCAGTLLSAWTADIAFVLDRLQQLNASPSGRFAGRLDLNRVGVFGHSFGGAAAALFCHEDSRCKAGIDVDGAPVGSVIQAGIDRPFMFLLSAQIESSDPESRQVKADIQSIYNRLPADARLCVEIRGANHFLFTDDGALLKSHILMRTLRTFGIVGIDGRRQLAVTAYCVHSFFDTYLKQTTASHLNLSSPLYPEIKVLE